MGIVSKLRRKLLLWLQKHYIYSKFKPDDTFLQSFFSPAPPSPTSTGTIVLHEPWPLLLLPAIGPNPGTFASISNAH
jgi:hypothetical protein